MKNLKQLLTSKRFGVAVAGVLLVISNDYLGLDLDTKSMLSIVGLVIAFVVSQGSADKGKEAAKINKGELASMTEAIERVKVEKDRAEQIANDKARAMGWGEDGDPSPPLGFEDTEALRGQEEARDEDR